MPTMRLLTRPIDVIEPGEGDWQLYNDDHAGEDTDD